MRVTALALRSWTAGQRETQRSCPRPKAGTASGKRETPRRNRADSSLRRAKTSSRSLPGCTPRDGDGDSSRGALRSSSRRSARVPSHSGSDRSPTPPSRPEKSVSQGRHRPSRGQGAERQRRRSWALERWARYVGPGPSRSPVWPSSSRPTWSCQITGWRRGTTVRRSPSPPTRSRRIRPGRRDRSPKSRSQPESHSPSSKPSKGCWSTREPTWRRSSPTGTREASARSWPR